MFLLLWGATRVLFAVWFRYRSRGATRPPACGPVLFVSNHASFLDPVLIGAATCRPLGYLARSTLFRSRLFAAVIRALGAVPVEREGVGVGGTRAVLSILAGGGAVAMFPEGTRTRDGTLGEFRPGAARIAQKSGAQVVPVWIEGSRAAMPAGAIFPRPRRIEVRIGSAYRVPAGVAPEAATEEMRERLLALAGSPAGEPGPRRDRGPARS